METYAKKPRVLVVDDDASLRSSLRRLLSAAGHEVTTYATPQEFLDGYVGSVGGVLLLDLRMPGMSGLDVCRALAKRHAPDLRILMTAATSLPLEVTDRQLEIRCVLRKPFAEEALFAAIEASRPADAPHDAAGTGFTLQDALRSGVQ